ncbi:universal stress protein [Actinopolymorpha pittospori]
MNSAPTGMLVVGVDGSASAEHALAWAMTFAYRNRVGVHAVAVTTPMPASPFLSFPSPPEELDELMTRGQTRMLESAVERATSKDQPVVVHKSVAHGNVGPVLCALAAGAPALVLGSRGYRPALSTVLGSVSAYCVRHASCPVVVVPPAAAIAQESSVA